MIHRILWSAALILGATGTHAADEPGLARQVGTSPGLFTLEDASTRREVTPESFRGKKAAVLIFLGTDCPVSNQYLPRLAEFARNYEARSVLVLGINSNAHESAESVAAHAREFAIPFLVLKDEGSRVADLYQARRTCEVLLLDENATIRYRGAIDDEFGYGTRRQQSVEHFLTDAIDQLLDGKPIELTGTEVVGCLIDRPEHRSTASSTPKAPAPATIDRQDLEEAEIDVGDVNYASNVATILQNRCQNCHRPKAAAPFSLLTYDDARRWSASIREVVDERRMPPWHADPRFGRFENDRRLSAREKATLVAWVDQGTPLGDPKDLPEPRAFPDGWAVGEPDVVYEMPQEYVVPADGVVSYQHFQIPLNLAEDRWVQSVECLPGDRSVVHHIIAFSVVKGREGAVYLGGYAPGELPSVFNPGIARHLPANSEIVLQVHYTPMGKVRKDRSRVGLIFAKSPPTHEGITHPIENRQLVIPPGDDNAEIRSQFTFDSDSHLLSFMPHMHLRGKDFKYTVTYPGKEPETLLSVPAYDFAWQSVYRLAEPLFMPRGTVIDCIAHFDNSANNPANPDPKATVKWGDQTFEEMMSGFIDYYRDEPIGGLAAGTRE